MTEDRKNELMAQPVEEKKGIVRVAGDVAEAWEEYQKLQAKLDHTMKDSTMMIRGKLFRKKSYWRAIATAFNLNVYLIQENQVKNPTDENDWGWVVTYAAQAGNGRYAVGDGACFASEKTGPGQATVHNVRGHAHTRGYNRAVSNLVGFGEVSAEEMQQENGWTAPPKDTESNGGKMTDKQRAKIYATANELAGQRGEDVKEMMQDIYKRLGLNVKSMTELNKKEASDVIEKLVEIAGENMTP